MSSVRQLLVITGASRGLGRALTEAAVAAGHPVVGTVRRQSDAEMIEALGTNAHARLADVTDDDAVADVLAWTEREIGRVDVVVANAG